MIATMEKHEAATTVHAFLAQVSSGLEVTDYGEYRAVMHDSGLVEALGTLVVTQPNVRGADLDAQTGHASGPNLDVWSGVGDGMVTIRTRQRKGAGARVRHNLYLFVGEPGSFGDIASRSDDKIISAESWDGEHHRPCSTPKLNQVIQLGSIAIEQFARLVI
jgi:hypothetical protein